MLWQQSHQGGAVVVSGGEFVKEFVAEDLKSKNANINQVPNLGTYNAESKTFNTSASNVTITLAKDTQDLTIKSKGYNNHLHLTDGVNVKNIQTDGQLMLHYGNEMKEINGRNRIEFHDGQLKITPELNQQTKPSTDKQSHSALENINNSTLNFGQMGALRAAELKMADHQIPEQYHERLKQLVVDNVVAHNLSVDRVETVTRSSELA